MYSLPYSIFHTEENMSKEVAYQIKRFREKPYTQCFECIQGNKIKCKNCMSSLIKNALERQSSMRTYDPLIKSPKGRSQKMIGKNGCKTLQVSRAKSPEQRSEVSTIYEQWLKKVKSKQNSREISFIASPHGWPLKKTAKQLIERADQPKYETWEGRFLKRLSHTSAKQLGLHLNFHPR